MEVQLSGGNYGGLVVNFENNQTKCKLINDQFQTCEYELSLNSNPLEANFTNCFNDEEAFNNKALRLKQIQVWELIKIERERKKFSGIKVGEHWFHTDNDSRIQQLGLVNAAAVNAIPPGFMWKTLTPGGGLFNPVSVEMTNDLARNIFFHTMLHDGMFHQAGENHRLAMIACTDLDNYDYKINWPLNFEDIQNEYNLTNV